MLRKLEIKLIGDLKFYLKKDFEKQLILTNNL